LGGIESGRRSGLKSRILTKHSKHMKITSILSCLPDRTLALITRAVLTKRGKIVIDEDTFGFLYAKTNGKPALYIMDSDRDFMRLDGRLAGRGKPAFTAKTLYEQDPSILEIIDEAAFLKLEKKETRAAGLDDNAT
jgi:hypothetical protein